MFSHHLMLPPERIKRLTGGRWAEVKRTEEEKTAKLWDAIQAIQLKAE
jgi:hypothetical protein